MCFKLNNLVESIGPKISPVQKNILSKLALMADSEKHSCYPSFPTIAARSGYKIRTVYYAIKALVKLGLIKKGKSHTLSNLYTLQADKIIALHAVHKSVGNKTAPAQVARQTTAPHNKQPLHDAHSNSHINNHLFNNHYDHAQTTCAKLQEEAHLKEIVYQELMRLNWKKKCIAQYLEKFGAQTILNELKRLRHLATTNKAIIYNLGAYLRKSLDNLDKSLRGKHN